MGTTMRWFALGVLAVSIVGVGRFAGAQPTFEYGIELFRGGFFGFDPDSPSGFPNLDDDPLEVVEVIAEGDPDDVVSNASIVTGSGQCQRRGCVTTCPEISYSEWVSVPKSQSQRTGKELGSSVRLGYDGGGRDGEYSSRLILHGLSGRGSQTWFVNQSGRASGKG
jgi:hypothetical protein